MSPDPARRQTSGGPSPAALTLAEAKAIVRALAATPVLQTEGVYQWCVLCDASTEGGADVHHKFDCPWERARHWVENNP